jgi:hypothetical protein
LSFHRSYGCRHSGACCTAGWPIAVEADRLPQIQTAIAAGRLTPDPAAGAPFVQLHPSASDAAAVLATAAGRCVFHDAAACRCRVQRVLGHAALPLACRQFPRVTVIDRRGASVTLSHFCPTAAALLEDEQPVTIDPDPPAFPADAEYSGLDARHAMPPLLRPDMLMDWESWWEWERLAVETLSRHPPDHARDLLSGAVERVRSWGPGDGLLIDRVREGFDAAPVSGRVPRSADALTQDVLAAIPEPHRPAGLTPPPPPATGGVLSRFLAAHAFANWTAHFGQGLRTWLQSIDAAYALATGLGVRQADLLLRHLVDPEGLANSWSRWEQE